MSKYVEGSLVEGESVVHWGVPSLWGFAKPLGLAVVFLFLGVAALEMGAGTLAIYLLVIPPNVLLLVWLAFSSIEIAITDKRVLTKTGIVQRETSELYLTRIEGVEVDQTVLGRILGFGSIRIRGTGDQVATVRNISHPLAFRKALFSAGDKLLRTTRGSDDPAL